MSFCFIAFVVGILILKSFEDRKNALKSVFYFLCVSFLIASNGFIFDSLFNIFQTFGFRSRTLSLVINNAVFQDSGRSYIYDAMIQELFKNPLKIHGIASEYAFTGGAYAHNFILELLFDFGIFFGGFAVLYILFQAFETLLCFIKRGNANDSVNFILFSSSFLSALVSGTIWASVYFWLWLLMNKEQFAKKTLS